MTFANTNTVEGTLVQGGVSALALTFVSNALTVMLPFVIAAAVLIAADLHFGCAAAHKRGDYRLSRAIRLTINKISEYVCWIILAATLSIAFNLPALNYAILALVMGNELISIITNYLYVHNKRIKGLDNWFVRFIGGKFNADLDGVEIEDIEQDERKRAPKGKKGGKK